MSNTNAKTNTSTARTSTPVVLCISGHDPVGGAGIQADIEVLKQHGCHSVSVLTCTTTQDTKNIKSIEASDANIFLKQIDTLLNDIEVNAIKIGLLPNIEIAEALLNICAQLSSLPIIYDPVLKAGGGFKIVDVEMLAFIKRKLMPFVHIISPNLEEASVFAGLDRPFDISSDNCEEYFQILASCFNELGSDYFLLTGGHNHFENEGVINRLWHQEQLIHSKSWPRLDGHFHGTGCTLSTAIAANLVKGEKIINAVEKAQAYTFDSIQKSNSFSKGQNIPNRIF